jgi:hypothetical protein
MYRGLLFELEEDLLKCCDLYARRTGFTWVTVGSRQRNNVKDGRIKCQYGGAAKPRKETSIPAKSKKVNCLCALSYAYVKTLQKWRINKCILDHINHDLEPEIKERITSVSGLPAEVTKLIQLCANASFTVSITRQLVLQVLIKY